MSTNKTQFDLASAETFVAEHFHYPGIELEQIEDGETSQAFFFEAEEGPRVLRVSSRDKFGFQKDQLAQARFGSLTIPIPAVFDIGELDSGIFYAVSARMPGKTLDKFTPAELEGIMPSLMSTLDAIHAIPPIGEGYGNWGLDGKGRSKTWEEELERQLHLDDDETTSAEFYDAGLAERLRSEVLPRIGHMPEERKLLHWDYGFNNALSDGKDITGVIDWEHSSYGDPVFDVAWLDFWEDKQGYASDFKKHYEGLGIDISGFDDRLATYKLLIGLGSLGFFARSRQADKYKFAQDVIARIAR